MSDNGPQYSSSVFQTFSKDYGFRHQTSSPHYPQGNGEAERAVQTVKRLIRNATDPYLALLAYRATPLKNGSSPAELLMGRKLRTTLPENPRNYYPKWPDLERVRQVEEQYRQNQKFNFDKARRARPLSQLNAGETVWVKGEGGGTTGTVIDKTQQSDRSYIIETDNGAIRRNRRHLEPANMLKDEVFASDTFDQDNNMQSVKNPLCENVCCEKLLCTSQNQSATNDVNDQHVRADQKSSRITRSGRVSKPVQRLDL